MVKGIIYRYESPSGKSYVGQTTDEKHRRRCFFNNCCYSGTRFDNAIRKYGVHNFKYEALFSDDFDSKEDAIPVLNEKESYFIKKYDSYRNGYNMTLGGEGVRGHTLEGKSKENMINHLKDYYKSHSNPFKGKKHSEDMRAYLSELAKNRTGERAPMYGKHLSDKQKAILSKCAKERKGSKNPFFNKKHTNKAKNAISTANSKPVLQIDAASGEVLKRFNSALEAGESLGNSKLNSEIVKVCRGYVSPSGRHYITCKGYKWKYAQ